MIDEPVGDDGAAGSGDAPAVAIFSGCVANQAIELTAERLRQMEPGALLRLVNAYASEIADAAARSASAAASEADRAAAAAQVERMAAELVRGLLALPHATLCVALLATLLACAAQIVHGRALCCLRPADGAAATTAGASLDTLHPLACIAGCLAPCTCLRIAQCLPPQTRAGGEWHGQRGSAHVAAAPSNAAREQVVQMT